MRRGDVYLVNFGKKYNSEFAKIRPALIVQNNIANRNIDKVDFKAVTVMPLTSIISGGNLRVAIKSRDKLEKDSDICINELCTLDLSRIQLNNLLTLLTPSEQEEVDLKLKAHLDLK